MGHLYLVTLLIASVFIDGLHAAVGEVTIETGPGPTTTHNTVTGITVEVDNTGTVYTAGTLISSWTVHPALSDETVDIVPTPTGNTEGIEVRNLMAGTFYAMELTAAQATLVADSSTSQLTVSPRKTVVFVTKPKAPTGSDMYVLSKNGVDDNVCILYANSKDENSYNKVNLQITQSLADGSVPTALADPSNDIDMVQEAGIKCISLSLADIVPGFVEDRAVTIEMKLVKEVDSVMRAESVSATKTLDLSEKKFNVTLSYNEGKCIRTSLDDAEDEMWDCKVMMMPEYTGLDKDLVYEYTVNGGGMNEMTGHVYNHDCEDNSVAGTRMCEKYISGLKRDIGYTVTFTKIFVYGYMPQSFTLPSDDMYHIAFTAFAFNAQAINMAALLLMSFGCSKLF